MATDSFLRSARTSRGTIWLHNCFCSSGAGRVVATDLANAVELSTCAVGTAVRCVIFDSAGADNSHGFDVAP